MKKLFTTLLFLITLVAIGSTPITSVFAGKAEKVKRQRKKCGFVNCSKLAKKGGFCVAHGGGVRCSFNECNKSGLKGGLCVAHGGGVRCSFNECNKHAQKGGLCVAHGGGVRCSFNECNRSAQKGGLCIAHGGGIRCSFNECNKSAQKGGLCLAHGGGVRCSFNECNKHARKGGLCKAHFKIQKNSFLSELQDMDLENITEKCSNPTHSLVHQLCGPVSDPENSGEIVDVNLDLPEMDLGDLEIDWKDLEKILRD